MTSTRIPRVTRKCPCPICEHNDWCGYTDEIAICMRISQGSVAESSNGGWIHRVEGQPIPRTPSKPKVSLTGKCEKLRATVERLNQVYTPFVERLTLFEAHGTSLLGRGLCDVGIAREGYASVPGRAKLESIVRDLSREFDLDGVPGFYLRGSMWTLVGLPPGILIPSRDPKGRIQALRIRLDKPHGSQKYMWVSSVEKPDGVSSGAPMHFARPWRVMSTGQVIITEGELKADVAAQFLDDAVLGLPGVTVFKESIGADLRAIFPNLTRVRIAFDCDASTNAWVKEAELRLARALSSAGLTVTKMTWPDQVDGTRVKGIDDFVSSAYAK